MVLAPGIEVRGLGSLVFVRVFNAEDFLLFFNDSVLLRVFLSFEILGFLSEM